MAKEESQGANKELEKSMTMYKSVTASVSASASRISTTTSSSVVFFLRILTVAPPQSLLWREFASLTLVPRKGSRVGGVVDDVHPACASRICSLSDSGSSAGGCARWAVGCKTCKYAWRRFGESMEGGHQLKKGSFGQVSGSRIRAQVRAIAVAEARDVQRAKFDLLTVVNETGRGLKATSEKRAEIEEALVGVEKFDAGKPVELNELEGTWLLQYTSAPDVVSILQAAETPFFEVGQIFQKFECDGQTAGGTVKNVVRWSIPGILEEQGATLIVTASFSVVGCRSIALGFKEANVKGIFISESLQGLIAPAALPRTFFNLEVLQFLRSLDVRIALIGRKTSSEDLRRATFGLRYYLTYLDKDMLLGRAIGSGGIFIFSRTQNLQL